MQWAAALSVETELENAIAEASATLRTQLHAPPDLLIAFASTHHRARFPALPPGVASEFPRALLVGCSAGGVIGAGREVEDQPALSLTAAVLPRVEVLPLRMAASAPRDHFPTGPDLERVLGVPAAKAPHFVLLPEPFSFDSEAFVRALDATYPGARKVGGLASGATQPGGNALFLGTETFAGGLVGVALAGDIEVDTIVAQGCRPIGAPMFVTKCQNNIVWELDGQPAVEVLRATYAGLPTADQQLARHSLFLGLVMSEHQQEYRHGDFLVRNLLGMDAERGVIAVGAMMHENMVVQFHLRDARTSADDLEAWLSGYSGRPGAVTPQGALLFSCLGRGRHLYGHADHDTGATRRHLGDLPLGGFFCNGEIGPVHEHTYLHGYTSSFGLFRPKLVN